MTPAQYNGLLAAIQGATVATSGTIIMYAKGTPPGGYLPCDGAAVSRTTYASLFGVCGTTYGAGDASTTFNVPDLRSRLPMGAGAGPGLTVRALGSQGGAEGMAVAQANLVNFALPVTDPGHQHDVAVSQDALIVPGQLVPQGQSANVAPGTAVSAASLVGTGVTVATGGGATPLPTLDPFTAVGYFVKT